MSVRGKILTMSLRLAFAAAAAAAPLSLPDLSGTWRLNRQLSDDPSKVLRDGSSDAGAPSGWSRRGRGRMGGAGRERSEPAADPEMFSSGETLTIRHREPELSLTDAAGRERTVYTDARKSEEERSRGGTTKVTARWKDGHVEIVSVPERGPRVVETYAVTADRRQLTVTTRLERGRGAITIRRVYDAAAPTPPAPEKTPPPPQSDEDQEEIRTAR